MLTRELAWNLELVASADTERQVDAIASMVYFAQERQLRKTRVGGPWGDPRLSGFSTGLNQRTGLVRLVDDVTRTVEIHIEANGFVAKWAGLDGGIEELFCSDLDMLAMNMDSSLLALDVFRRRDEQSKRDGVIVQHIGEHEYRVSFLGQATGPFYRRIFHLDQQVYDSEGEVDPRVSNKVR